MAQLMQVLFGNGLRQIGQVGQVPVNPGQFIRCIATIKNIGAAGTLDAVVCYGNDVDGTLDNFEQIACEIRRDVKFSAGQTMDVYIDFLYRENLVQDLQGIRDALVVVGEEVTAGQMRVHDYVIVTDAVEFKGLNVPRGQIIGVSFEVI